MKYDTAGDPVTGIRWSRRSTQKIARELQSQGIAVSSKTVGKILKDMDFSLKGNRKMLSKRSAPDRDEQFSYIAEIRQQFVSQGVPIVSVDSKKRELIGNFENAGRTWNKDARAVNDHDFRSDAEGIGIPYGIYDVQRNDGSVFVGTSCGTAEFAVGNLEKWWRYTGKRRYPNATQILILADGGGSNGYRCRAWKFGIQKLLCDRHGLTVTVSHYPTGTSKWNPIEHRLFSEISKNWAGTPLISYETMLNFIRSTKTTAGLRVRAYLVRKEYAKGVRISDTEMREVHLQPHDIQPVRNYTLSPRGHDGD